MFDRQSMIWCGINCGVYQLDLQQVHLAKEVESVRSSRLNPDTGIIVYNIKTPSELIVLVNLTHIVTKRAVTLLSSELSMGKSDLINLTVAL